MELRNDELSARISQDQDNIDAKFEIQELKEKCSDFVSENEKIMKKLEETEVMVKEKEYVINDCNIYIENLTEQVNEKIEEARTLAEELQNNSQVEAKEAEIASLETKLAESNSRLDTLQTEISESQQKVELLERENEEKNEAMISLDDELTNTKQLYNTVNANMSEYNKQIANLQADLSNRNKEILEFVKIMKNIKESLLSRGSPLSAFIDVNVKEESNELSWDHGYEEILEPTKNFIEKLVDDNLEKSKQLDGDKSAHIKYLDDRVGELENVLAEKESLIAELLQTERELNEAQAKLGENEKEQFEMQAYLNSKLAEINQFRQELSSCQEEKKSIEDNLTKAMSAIQGFVTDNLKLSQAVTEKESQMVTDNRRLTKESDHLLLENERLKSELEAASQNCLDSAAKTFYMQKGLDKAELKFTENLEEYRAKFDKIFVAWRTGVESCDLLRARLEELAGFMQNILDGEGQDDLNLSCLSVDMRDLLQKSVDESRLLSASILAGQNSVLMEMSTVGLELHSEELESFGIETWTVPKVDVSIFESSNGAAEETVPKSEYDCLLLELRDNLTKRRLAEEELEKVKASLDLRSESQDSSLKSLIPVADGSAKTKVRSSSRRRKTLTKIPGPVELSEEGDWSEPDKVESRRRIGLEDEVGEEPGLGGARSSDEHGGDAETGAEMRRERGRVERLRSDLAVSQRSEAELTRQLQQVNTEFAACSKALEKCKREMKKNQDLATRIEGKSQQIDGENEEQRLIIRNLEKERTDIERRLNGSNETIDKLNKALDWWKSECKRFQQEFEFVGGGGSAGEKLELEQMNENLRNAEMKYQDLMEKYNNLLEVDQQELQGLKSKYQKKKTDVTKLKGTNILLEERCAELEEVVKVNDLKLSSKEETLSTAESLLKELNENNKTLKEEVVQLKVQNSEITSELDQLKTSFANYRQQFSDEIIQNKVNEVETKMKIQANGMKKLAEELLRVEADRKLLENRLESREDLQRTAEKEIDILRETLSEEKSRTVELGKTLENMHKNIAKLEEEKIIKDSLEIEFANIKQKLIQEKEGQANLKVKLTQVENSKKVAEKRCASAEKVLKTLTTDSFYENKENREGVEGGYNLSKHELETALQHSRPGSRRQGLASLDNMNNLSRPRTSLPCCSHLSELDGLRLERDAALAKLKSTRSHLASAAEKLSLSNKKKKEMEKELCQQLSKTHKVLRKTKTNLENFSNSGGAENN